MKNIKSPGPIGLGVIGCGNIAYWVHLRLAKRISGAKLIAAADPDSDARQRAEKLAGVPVYASNAELLARDEVDAVIVSGPTHLHADLVVAACEAGKHVYLEKPIASTTSDGARVIDAASKAGVTVMLGFNRRFHPVFQHARQLIRDGRIGRVRAVQTTFCEPARVDAMPAWRRERATGGGVLLDLASHHVDLLRWFLDDEVAKVEASIESELSDQDSVQLQLMMQGGAHTQSLFSSRTGASSDWFEFAGECGTLRVDRHRAGVSLRVPRRFGYGVRTMRVMPPPAVAAWSIKRIARPSAEPSYIRALAEFVRGLSGEPHSMPTLVDGMRALEVAEAAEESALRGCAVEMRTP
ncbi:MAG: Gfo/Idh/MocA family oxidoreductase [Gemmatimonadales bacterium]